MSVASRGKALVEKNENYRKGEGDINTSSARLAWQESHIDPTTRAILEADEKYFLHQSLSTPCLNALKSCKGIYIEDMTGKKIMDFHGNNVHQVGFSNSEVIDAVKKQLDELSFCTRRYTNSRAIELAEKLSSLAPGDLNKVLLAPGATSSIGIALKLARISTGRFKTLSAWDAFHGASLDALSIGGEATFREGLGPLLPGTEHVLPVNNYRCVWGECKNCGLKCVKYIEFVLSKERDIGAVILETIRNTDVQIPPKGYYSEIRKLCDKYGALLILDETAIALGRTGKMFAFENYSVEPDMVIIGKGLGGGIIPLSALIVREKLDVAVHTAIGHYTHEKSPVGSAAALAVIKYIEDNSLLSHTIKLGIYLKKRLKELAKKHAIIGNIRGIGLLYAIELVKDPITKEPATDAAEKVMYSCLEKGLSFKVSQGNVLTLSPPLIISEKELDLAVTIIDKAISEYCSKTEDIKL
jgi:4-aminobutyrate aminotransferase and related aminotransferases